MNDKISIYGTISEQLYINKKMSRLIKQEIFIKIQILLPEQQARAI